MLPPHSGEESAQNVLSAIFFGLCWILTGRGCWISATGDNLSKKVHILFKVEQDTELVVVDNPVVLVMFVSNALFSFGGNF